MRIALPAATLGILAACSVQVAPDNAASPTPSPTPVASPTPAAAADVPVRPGALKTFGDWAVGCDNTHLCTMASLGPDGGLFPEVTMAILRQPGPAGGFDLSFDVPGEGRPTTPVAVSVDGKRLPLATLNGAAAQAVVRALANGTTLAVLEAGDRQRAVISLAGASAALRYIDAQQGRAGTVTAVVATGAQPADTVPEATAAPVVRAPVATGIAATPTATQLARMRQVAGCEDDRMADSDIWKPETHPLGGGATLVLLPCSAGAYNLSSTLFVMKDGKVAPARVDAPTGFGPTPAAGTDRLESVVNGTWKDGELTSYAKGRGLGDCGVSQTLVWDGTRLRLTDQAEMGECRGNPNYITTWRTQVVRG
ncbi:DUF1176 domain-containing protein [Sphingomonas sp. KR1UV-12]|uniref:DUF1176 domain-containing protein n=1 Tax=Sphingomonas aurea TaxID=3063994 RepID=A0ABT9EM24_9SPHN|nr:DUF1176 domain-containing protein [Sphingomonas sp. KR1UV-12]MDP1028000.1 DUF1176 domain-containing protein [Sphingomonas sp. KR1UV-12]